MGSFATVGESRDKRYIKAFGDNLRRLRISKKLSQEELAYRSGLVLSQVGRIERGERGPTLTTMLALAKGMGVEPKKLLDFEFS